MPQYEQMVTIYGRFICIAKNKEEADEELDRQREEFRDKFDHTDSSFCGFLVGDIEREGDTIES